MILSDSGQWVTLLHFDWEWGIEGEGFTAEELLGDGVNISKTRRKAPAKYEFVENGETKTWTGKGRKPKPIAEALSAGRSLDEFLIKK